MSTFLRFGAVMAALHLAGWSMSALSQTAPRGPILLSNVIYDQRTVIAPSKIPGSGFGLFARVAIKEGEVIGELGGQLLAEPDPLNPSAYLAGLPDCAVATLQPYRYLDSKEHGGHVSRANFAPRMINGKETHFQNARIHRVCEAPYVVFMATKDIAPGAEIWASYGPHYDYERFMDGAAVKAFFCDLAGVDCREKYEFEP